MSFFLFFSNNHILVDFSPYMFDGKTLKSTPALAVKSIEALKDGSKVFVADEGMLARRS